jgi:hypothetical protein
MMIHRKEVYGMTKKKKNWDIIYSVRFSDFLQSLQAIVRAVPQIWPLVIPSTSFLSVYLEEDTDSANHDNDRIEVNKRR